MDLPGPLKIAGPMAFAPFCFPLGRPDHSCFMPIFEFISLKFSWDCKYKGKWVFTGHMAARTIAILQKSLIFRHISYDWLEDDNQGNSTEVDLGCCLCANIIPSYYFWFRALTMDSFSFSILLSFFFFLHLFCQVEIFTVLNFMFAAAHFLNHWFHQSA